MDKRLYDRDAKKETAFKGGGESLNPGLGGKSTEQEKG